MYTALIWSEDGVGKTPDGKFVYFPKDGIPPPWPHGEDCWMSLIFEEEQSGKAETCKENGDGKKAAEEKA